MKILLCGDVVGRSGREAVSAYLPDLKKKYAIDFVVVNVDNAAHGFGVTAESAEPIFAAGADVLTGGNHLFDNKTATALLHNEKRILRPANMAGPTPGTGVSVFTTFRGESVLVVHLLGQKNMALIGENPFHYMNAVLEKYKLCQNVQAIVVDFHADVTSEKNALGHFLDGRVSAVVGTHTHIPTADERILPKGTAFQTDIGMCGDYNSVIGMQKNIAIERFVKGYSSSRYSPASGDATFSGLLVETDPSNGLAIRVKAIRVGGDLKSTEGDSCTRSMVHSSDFFTKNTA